MSIEHNTVLNNVRIVPILDARLHLCDGVWNFAQENVLAIKAHWSRRTEEQPKLYDGDVLILTSWTLSGTHFFGTPETERASILSSLRRHIRFLGYSQLQAGLTEDR